MCVAARRYARCLEKKTKTSEELIALGRKHGVEVTITTKPPGTGEIVPLPGIRAEDERRADLLQDDDGSGVVE